MSNTQKSIAAFFDLDHTILYCDSFRRFIIFEYFSRPRKWFYIIKILIWFILKKTKVISLQTMKEKSILSFVGKKESDIQKKGGFFFNTYLIKMIKKGACDRIAWHHDNNHLVFIITGSPNIYLEPLSRYLKVDGFECSTLEYINEEFTGHFKGEDCLGVEKKKRITSLTEKFNLDLSNSYAYSDHESDLPIMELVGKPIAISPTKMLHGVASERDWPIRYW